MLRILTLVFALSVSARAQLCDYIGLEVFAQDSGAGKIGTYLGLITTSTVSAYSILNPVGQHGSSTGARSIYNEFGTYGSQFGTYSAYNEFATNPPMILEYRSSTGLYHIVGYVSTSAVRAGAVHPSDLKSVLRFGNCAGCAPKIIYDTLFVRDTVVQIDTLVIRDTLRLIDTVAIRDTISTHDTLVVRDTVIQKDTVKYCPPTLAKTSSAVQDYRTGPGSDALGRTTKIWARCRE
jgi:hypothetical protein